MQLLRNNELVTATPVRKMCAAENETPGNVKPDALALLSLTQFLDADDATRDAAAGIWLAPTDDPQQLRTLLGGVKLIAIEFPVYTDGRGYSHARTLRSVLGFTGELRAIGDIRPDQLLFMLRVGLDSIELPDNTDASLISAIQQRYSLNYQQSYPLPLAG